MRHAFAREFRAEDYATPPSTVVPPLTPAGYLTLCRKRAGVTIEQAASRIAPRDMVDIAERLLRDLERPGTVAKRTHTLLRISYAFPLNVAVYRQLAEAPPERHPAVCRGCGLTAADNVEACGDAVRMVSATSCARCDEAPLRGFGR